MKKRIVSALVALLICMPLAYIGGVYFKMLILIISMLGFNEIIRLITNNKLLKVASMFCFITIIVSNINKISFNNILNYRLIGIILILLSLLKLIYHKDKDLDVTKIFSIMAVTILLSISFSVMIITRNISFKIFIYLFLITIMTDTFAQITGILFGHHKINEISPNKTYEGCIGGSLFGTLIPVLFYLSFINSNINIFIIVSITFFLTIIGQIGDLFFSLIKRHYNIKDFSNIMPGHGGILDRLDSVIFVMLAITYFINFI